MAPPRLTDYVQRLTGPVDVSALRGEARLSRGTATTWEVRLAPPSVWAAHRRGEETLVGAIARLVVIAADADMALARARVRLLEVAGYGVPVDVSTAATDLDGYYLRAEAGRVLELRVVDHRAMRWASGEWIADGVARVACLHTDDGLLLHNLAPRTVWAPPVRAPEAAAS